MLLNARLHLQFGMWRGHSLHSMKPGITHKQMDHFTHYKTSFLQLSTLTSNMKLSIADIKIALRAFRDHHAARSSMIEQPYIHTAKTIVRRTYNPSYGDDRMCKCGHSYYRHFDTYEDMHPVGCKYCDCFTFEEAV